MRNILNFLLSFLILSVLSINLYSQDKEEPKKDTVFIDQDFEINVDENIDKDEDFWDFEEFKFRFRKESHPFLKFKGGLNQFAHKSATENFRQTGNFEVQLGYTRRLRKSRSYLAAFKDRYIGFSLNNNNLYKSSRIEPNELSNYQFSVGRSESYGYRTKALFISLGTGDEFNWTRNTFNKNSIGPDSLILDFYKDAVRFGEAYNSEFSLQLFDFISLQANYKYGLIFPRHLFWKHLGSFVIEEVTRNLLEDYLEKVFSMRPAAGPVVNFILQSSLNYLFYEFKKERMNWPFKSVQPLTYDIYSIGLKFTF